MKRLAFILFLFLSTAATYGQKLKKSEQIVVNDLKESIYFLADDKLEGRRAGSEGERKAAEYIIEKFKSYGIQPMGDNGSFKQAFPINEGRKILGATTLVLNGATIDTSSYFPLTFSSEGVVRGMAAPAIHESGEPWFVDLSFLLSENAKNPHFDLEEQLKKEANAYKLKGATAIAFYTSGPADPDLFFDGHSRQERLSIPVIYIRKQTAAKYLISRDDFVNLSLNIATAESSRTGYNVIGYIDNGAPNTIVIGAHYDHLGYGQDHNSLWAGAPQIHNGADDNASGTALIIEAAKALKVQSHKRKSAFKDNNYLLMCFSGEELGLYGSKFFTEHPTIPLESVNFMINCDMVGRLNNDTKGITVGGYGTSPYWSALPEKTKFLNIKFDSSGIGPSDHTSFYLKNIPVLFFFTGTHPDYHKPTDDADKINYTGELRVFQYIMDVVESSNKAGKLSFTKTKEPAKTDAPRFTVTLGVMPDYTYSGTGLKIDGVIDGRVAQKAGMKAGDVITKLGDYKVSDINDYMKALSHFKKGDKTTVEYQEGAESKTVAVEF